MSRQAAGLKRTQLEREISTSAMTADQKANALHTLAKLWLEADEAMPAGRITHETALPGGAVQVEDVTPVRGRQKGWEKSCG